MKTIQDVADELKVSTSYVRRLVREGQIDSVRMGRRLIRIRDEDFERFIETRNGGKQDGGGA